jgi:glutamate 5-kinase
MTQLMNKIDRIALPRRIVVKVGSGVLTAARGLNLEVMRAIGGEICSLSDRGIESILVSSGAMASGLRKIGLAKRPEEIPKRQAIAAVGQAGLILEYERIFERFGKKVAQILLTGDDLGNRKRYLNARNTLNTLLSWKIVPIINENDTVMVEEIKFGDNDNLAAMITLLMDADLLINLTDIDGLYTKDPRSFPDAELIPKVSVIKKDLEKLASAIPGTLGTGGMLSKIKAARKVTASGVPMVIANGGKAEIITRILSGEPEGTFFVPETERLPRRKCWIGFTLKPKGIILIDDGAAGAVRERGKSLLPSGVVGVEGEFGVGSPVEVKQLLGEHIGTGLVNYSAADIRKIMGLKSDMIMERLGEKPYDEVIHRDNLVVVQK